MRILTMFIVSLALSMISVSNASASSETWFPQCESARVLNKVVNRFNQTERIYWHARGLRMSDIVKPHPHSENPFPESPINRRYCHADAIFDDGRKRRIHYLIEEDAGFAGFGWNVEYCIHGLDPWKYYDGRCRVLSR